MKFLCERDKRIFKSLLTLIEEQVITESEILTIFKNRAYPQHCINKIMFKLDELQVHTDLPYVKLDEILQNPAAAIVKYDLINKK